MARDRPPAALAAASIGNLPALEAPATPCRRRTDTRSLMQATLGDQVFTRSTVRRCSIRNCISTTTQPLVMNRTELRSASTTSGSSRSEGKARDQLAQRITVEQSAAAESVELGGDALDGVDQLVGFCVRFRQQAKRSPRSRSLRSIPVRPPVPVVRARTRWIEAPTRPPIRASRRRCRSHAWGAAKQPSAPRERRFPPPPQPRARDRDSDARRQPVSRAWPATLPPRRAKASRARSRPLRPPAPVRGRIARRARWTV
jgi:hypothetical protein